MFEAVGAICAIITVCLVIADKSNEFIPWFLAFAFVAFGTAAAMAHDHKHPDGMVEDKVGKFYDTWTVPPRRIVSCCSRKDCYAAQVRRGAGGLEYLHKWSGTWAALPSSVIEHNQVDPRESPNGENHVCASEHYPENVFCAVLGSGS